MRPSPLWTWFHLASCPGQRSQIKSKQQASADKSQGKYLPILPCEESFGIQLSDNKTKVRVRRKQKKYEFRVGVWAPWWILFCVALSPFVCVCVMFRISMRLWSYPFFSIHFECYVVQFNHPLTQVNMPLVAWLLSHPIFLESFEDTAFLDQQYRRLFQLGNRWKTKPEHICHDMNCGPILHCTSMHPAPKNSLLQESAIISRFSGNSQLLLFANPPVCLWTSAAKNDWHIMRVEDFKIDLKNADIQVAACPLSIMNHCDSFHLWPFFKSWVTQFSIFRFPTQNLLWRNQFGHPAEPIPSCSQWFLLPSSSDIQSPFSYSYFSTSFYSS